MSQEFLIVVDYQNDFVDWIGEPAEKIEDYLVELISTSRYNREVILTMDWHNEEAYKDSIEGQKFVKHCIENTMGAALYGKVAAYANSSDVKIFRKDKYVSDSMINYIIKRINESYEPTGSKITVCGLTTNICVLQTAVMLYNLTNAEIIVDAKGTADYEEDEGKGIEYLNGIGIKVINDRGDL